MEIWYKVFAIRLNFSTSLIIVTGLKQHRNCHYAAKQDGNNIVYSTAWVSWLDPSYYAKKYAQILPIILKLCHLSFVTYYSKNYAGMLGSGLQVCKAFVQHTIQYHITYGSLFATPYRFIPNALTR